MAVDGVTWMDADDAESGRNPVSKHQIDYSTWMNPSRETNFFRREQRRQVKTHIFPLFS